MGFSLKFGKVILGNAVLPDDEPVFVIRANDPLAANAVRAYGRMASNVHAPREHIQGVEEAAREIERYQHAHPDLIEEITPA